MSEQGCQEADKTREDSEGRRWVVSWEAPDQGPHMDVFCPDCGLFLGTVPQRGRGRVLCAACQSDFEVVGNGSASPTMRFMGRRAMLEPRRPDSDVPSLGQALRGGDDRPMPVRRFRAGQFFFSLLLATIISLAAILMLWLYSR